MRAPEKDDSTGKSSPPERPPAPPEPPPSEALDTELGALEAILPDPTPDDPSENEGRSPADESEDTPTF